MINGCKDYNRCIILAAGEFFDANIKINDMDYVIAVDGGLLYAQKLNIIPNLIVGDFDSLGYIPIGDNVIQVDSIKDDTDTLLAIKYGMDLGIKDFTIYFGFGGRFDHTYANLQTLHFLSKNNCKGYMIDKENVVTIITNSDILLKNYKFGYLSVFSFDSVATGVTIKGAKYELTEATLTNAFPIGVSNEFVDKDVFVSVGEGSLLITYCNIVD